MLPFGIDTLVLSFPLKPVPDQPIKLYPTLFGLFNVNVSVSTLYDVLLFKALFSASVKPLYVIL